MAEEAALEAELEGQLAEQEESLQVVAAALLENRAEELLQEADGCWNVAAKVQEELLEAVRVTKEGLLHLKRSRLLRELDDFQVQPQQDEARSIPSEVKMREEGQQIGEARKFGDDEIPEQYNPGFDKEDNIFLDKGDSKWMPGDMCRFRFDDGRWYTGEVLATGRNAQILTSGVARELTSEDTHEEFPSVLVGFAHPTSEKKQVCTFFRQSRCRFGESCRLSHGLPIPLHGLRPYDPPSLSSIPLGSLVLVSSERDRSGLWHKAELEFRNNEQNLYGIAYVGDGKRVEVEPGAIAFLEYEDGSDSSDESQRIGGEEEEEEEDENEVDDSGEARGEGLGRNSEAFWFTEAAKMAVAGIQSETLNFAKWEKHTRGIASKIMASMGFREGMGLGKHGQGIAKPVEVRVRPAKMALDFVDEVTNQSTKQEGEEEGTEKSRKRKGRGGERRRRQKLAAAVRLKKAEKDEEYAPDVFSFINDQLSKSTTSTLTKNTLKSGTLGSKKLEVQKSEKKAGLAVSAKEDRALLIAREQELKELVTRISRLEEMASRNKSDKSVFNAVQRKLVESRQALARAEGVRAAQEKVIKQRDFDKNWMKF